MLYGSSLQYIVDATENVVPVTIGIVDSLSCPFGTFFVMKLKCSINSHLQTPSIGSLFFTLIHLHYLRKHVETLEVDAAMVATGRVPNTKDMGLENMGIETQRGFIAVNEKMQVLTKHEDGEVIPHVYCWKRERNDDVGTRHLPPADLGHRKHLRKGTRRQPRCHSRRVLHSSGNRHGRAGHRTGREGGIGKSQGNFRANSKALAELEGNSIAKVCTIRIPETCGCWHIIGINSADLIQEFANAVTAGTTVQELSMMVHTHPTRFVSVRHSQSWYHLLTS